MGLRSGEILPTATRPAYTAVGTINTSMASASAATTTASSGVGRNTVEFAGGLVGMVVGVVALAL